MTTEQDRQVLERGSKCIRFLDMCIFILSLVVILCLANYPSLKYKFTSNYFFITLIVLFLCLNIMPSIKSRIYLGFRLKVCKNGCRLLGLFLITVAISSIYTFLGWLGCYSAHKSLMSDYHFWLQSLVYAIIVESIVFWNGMIRVYLTSKQLGIKLRIIGAICGFIPIVHLVILGIILQTAERELDFEHKKMVHNLLRKDLQVCKTKYPLLLVHGVFFRDIRYFNYWGRIPHELEQNGATVFYGNQQSAASVATCGMELAERIREIMKETGCEKVNIIAHSKGGLDSRYAISMCGMAEHVASLTTINTPHRGCEFAEYLLNKIPKSKQDTIAHAYNTALKKLGDPNPNFMEAVADLTAAAAKKRNELV